MPIIYALSRHGLIAVNDRGDIIWETPIKGLRLYGLDVDLKTGNIFTTTHKEILEVSRTEGIVWRYSNPRCLGLHSVQVTGRGVLVSSAKFDCAMEISKQEGVVWEWEAKDHYTPPPGYAYQTDKSDWRGDEPRWLHLNHAWRLDNGHTLIGLYYDPRDKLPSDYARDNQPDGMYLEVDENGDILWEWGRGITRHQHYILPYNDGCIACDSENRRVIMFKPNTGIMRSIKTDGNPHGIDVMPNGNLLVTLPHDHKIVQMSVKGGKRVYTVPENLREDTKVYTAKYLPSWSVEYSEREKQIIEERLRKLDYIE